METPKLKNIVLIILLVTNLFLLGFVGRRGLQNAWLEQQAREDAIRFVQEKTPELLTAMRTLAASLKPKERKPHGIS